MLTDFHNFFTAEVTVNTFSSVTKMKSAANWENFFRSSLRAVQFASVRSCAHRLLKHVSCRYFRMMRTTGNLGIPFFRDISRTVLWVRGWSSWLTTRSFTWSMFSSVLALRGLSLPWRLSTVPVSLNFLNNLLMLLVVHHLSRNSVLNCFTLYPFNWCKFFLLESYLHRRKPRLQTTLWRLG